MLIEVILAAGSMLMTAEEPAVRAERLYNGINRPIMLEVGAGDRGDAGGLELVLMTADGAVMADPIAVRPGRIDLADRVPQIWELRRACYLQLLQGGEPVGSALVLQPLMSRPPIWIERATRPDGKTRYTRIVGWGNEPPPGWKTRLTADE